MNQLIFADSKQDREHWLRERRKGLGASDAAAALGISEWATRNGLYLEKTGRLEPREATEATDIGNFLEDPIAQLFAARTGLRIEKAGVLMQHVDYDWMLATPDYVVIEDNEPGSLQIKFRTAWASKDWQGDNLPDDTHVQVLHEMAVMGVSFAYVCALVGSSLKIKRVERDDALIAQIIEAEKAFWFDHVVADVPPPLASGDCSLMDQLFGVSAPKKAIERDDLESVCADYKAAKATLDTAEDEVKRLQAILKDAMQDAETMHCGKYRTSWKNQTSMRVDSKALKAKYEAIYEQCLRPSVSRPFTMKTMED